MSAPKLQQRGPTGPPGAPATNFVGLVSTYMHYGSYIVLHVAVSFRKQVDRLAK